QRRAARVRQDFDLPPGEAVAGPVKALDHGLLGRPAAGQPLRVTSAELQLGRCERPAQEALARAGDRLFQAGNLNQVDPYPPATRHLEYLELFDRDALRQVPRLVDVAAELRGQVIREELEGDGAVDRARRL